MGNPVYPGKKTKYITEKVGVKIIAVTDEDGTDYMNGNEEASLKLLDYIEKHVVIKFVVTGIKQEIDLGVEYKRSKIHDNFYKQYKKDKFKPPRVAWIIQKKMYAPGEYEIEWNGRDDTRNKRLLLAGDYQIKILGRMWVWKKKHKVGLKVAKPLGYNYGVHYKKGKRWESAKKTVGYAEKSQKSLKDKTGFTIYSQFDRHAREAVEEMKSASVVYFDGHSNPGALVFHGKEGGQFKKKDQSLLYMSVKIAEGSNDAVLKDQKKGSFKDIFFIMMNSCRAGNEVLMYQEIVNYFNPKGVDGVHGDNTTKALRSFQNLHGIKPADGSKNQSTLKWFRIPREMDEEKQTRAIQKKLTGFFAGKADGVLGTKTEKSIKNYQSAHPKLNVTGKLDVATFKALNIGERTSGWFIPKNIADAMGYKGADITMGFIHKVGWNTAMDWAKSFWENLANGQGINTAASNAQASVDHRKRKHFDYNIYTMEGVSKESTLHPARYGAVRE